MKDYVPPPPTCSPRFCGRRGGISCSGEPHTRPATRLNIGSRLHHSVTSIQQPASSAVTSPTQLGDGAREVSRAARGLCGVLLWSGEQGDQARTRPGPRDHKLIQSTRSQIFAFYPYRNMEFCYWSVTFYVDAMHGRMTTAARNLCSLASVYDARCTVAVHSTAVHAKSRTSLLVLSECFYFLLPSDVEFHKIISDAVC